MKSWTKPTDKEVDEALLRLLHSQQVRHFFEKLENPYWLEPLVKRKQFLNPPKPIHDDNKGTVQFPFWPQLWYLTKIAKFGEFQEKVTEIALTLDTENIHIRENIIDIALILKSSLSKKLVTLFSKWIEDNFLSSIHEKLGKLVIKLASENEKDTALKLASTLFSTRKVREAKFSFKEIEPKFRVSDYRDILQENLKEYVSALGEPFLELLSDILENSINFSESKKPPFDFSHAWRPAIENHAKNYSFDEVKDILTICIRDSAESIVNKNPQLLEKIVCNLEKRKWRIFHRIALHLLVHYPQQGQNIFKLRILNDAYFDDYEIEHEYKLILKNFFKFLSDQEKQTILNKIETGPHREGLGKLNEEISKQYTLAWQRDLLGSFLEDLSVEWKDKYQKILNEIGHPIPYETEAWVGPTSPKSDEEISNLSINELTEYLKNWNQSGGWRDHSFNGLSRELSKVVTQKSDEFSTNANKFININPIYISALFEGFTNSINQNKPIEWENIINLAEWLVNQPRESYPATPSGFMGRDEDYLGWAYKSLARLITVGCNKGSSEIPYRFSENVWKILTEICKDPHPSPEDEKEFFKNSFEPASLAINSIRGEAIEAVVLYALWKKRNLEADGNRETSFSNMSEVETLLDYHLDIQNDPSLAIRSVYGRRFPWLAFLDDEWAKRNVDLVFPEDDQLYFEAAWQTYIVFCQPYRDVFALLEPKYRHSIENLNSKNEKRSGSHEKERLAQHLIILYIWKEVTLEGDTSVLNSFFKIADDKTRAHAIDFAGRNACGKISNQTISDLKLLWEKRISEIQRAKDKTGFEKELSSFGWWVASESLDFEWRIKQLLAVLELNPKVEFIYKIVEFLKENIDKDILTILTCLLHIISGKDYIWGIHSSIESIRTILSKGRNDPDEEVRAITVKIINKLGALGFLNFQDLLK